MIHQVLMQTVPLRAFDHGVRALRDDLGFELKAEGWVGDDLALALAISRRADAGFSATVPRVVASSPYDNRRVAALRGPVAERIELIEAHEPK